jgi:hypothetical protein
MLDAVSVKAYPAIRLGDTNVPVRYLRHAAGQKGNAAFQREGGYPCLLKVC